MHFGTIQRIIGILLILFSITLLPPVVVDFIYDEQAGAEFFKSYLVLLGVGLLLYFPVRNVRDEMRLRDGFLVVVLFWVVLCLAGSLPFYFYEPLRIGFTDALFESVSGLTTTGATVLTGLDEMPHGILFYRQELQWLGGMGIIVLAVAIMPMLGVGGMQLYKAEAPGPVKDSKLTPRIAETAKALWYIYLGLSVACAIAYYIAGMSMFDAISHAFSTVAIGGFSTHDASLGYFDNPYIEFVAIVFMILGGVNFALHFTAFRRRSPGCYFFDAEFKTYLIVLLSSAVIITVFLYSMTVYPSFNESFRQALFHSVSIGTTTGFTISDFSAWPSFAPVLLIFASFIGGCAGSTGGGIKAIRFLLLFKQLQRELTRLIHPSAVVVVKIGKQAVSNRVIDAVWGFFAAYVAVFVIVMLILMMSGQDQITAFSAAAATMNNLGPGLGDVSVNYAGLTDYDKWTLCLAMILGRLEIFTLLVLLSPAFWRK